ncbi:MAG: carbon-nitrogen hydrolase family protein [Sedimentisphaerales bacterium]|nr:carbon-nitrogen hydrolase family protein [Sedimentisphaerales bacterium]
MSKLMTNYLSLISLSVLIVLSGCSTNTQKICSYRPDQSMFLELKVAAITFKFEKFDVQSNVSKLEALFRQAAGEGAQLALAPEAAIDGFVVNDIIRGDIPAERIYDVAISIEDPVIQHFRDLARELNMALAFGFAELIDKEVFNCAVFIDNNGNICGMYHKMQFAEGYQTSWWFNRLGKSSRAFDTPFGRCGFLVCNDRWNPDLARIPVLDGAQYLLIPSYGYSGKEHDQAVLARARENGVPVVSANVGALLIISKGEIIKNLRQDEGLIVGTIAVPATPSPENRDKLERQFLESRPKEMQKRYKDYLANPW